MTKYTESTLEEATLQWFEELGYQIISGPEIAPFPDGEHPERENYADVILNGRFREAVYRINPQIPNETKEEVIKKINSLVYSSQSLIHSNFEFYKYLRNGVDVEYQKPDGTIAYDKAYLIDQNNINDNDWLAVNQFTVIENKHNRRPDVVVFLNGLPISVLELKNLGDETVSVRQGYNQLQTYKNEIPSLFVYNQLLVTSDGIDSRVGSLTANEEWFMRWRSVDGEKLAPIDSPQLEIMIKGIFDKSRLIDILTNFITYEIEEDKIIKKLAGYHQYFAVNKAIKTTILATKESGDRRCGVVWHTQGSGKSLTMTFYTGKIIQALNNPTIVIITDRNDLDDQLFGTFVKNKNLLRQDPQQVEDRKDLINKLKVASGGIVFTTIQKFLPENGVKNFPLISDRKNIVVIADEAHRSQYGFIDGFARHMREALPNASFIGFTGTPIEFTDANTRAVFGEYVDIYDISQAVDDHATVPIYYEARLAKIDLLESEKPKIDPEFEELTEGEEVEKKEKLKSKWARLEAMIGSEKRIKLIAKDIVEHFENRLSVMDGKGMIVTMSRRIAVELYSEIIKLKPEWHDNADDRGFLKVVMTGSAADPLNYQAHIRNKEARQKLSDIFKNPKSSFKLVIVRDMWLTGFDVPCLHTMYLDKPIKGHGLMQTIARVNRVYKDKQGGLIVDYLGLAPMLKDALATYTQAGYDDPIVPQEEAVSIMLEKFEITKQMFHGFDYLVFFKENASNKTSLILKAINFILGLEDGKKRYIQIVTELSRAFSLSVPNDEALKIRDEVAFFQTIKAGIIKLQTEEGPKVKNPDDYEEAIKQIVGKAVVSNEVIDIFKMAGLDKPNIAILSDEFLEEVKNMEHRNLALEALQKLLNDSLRVMSRTNLVKSRSFVAMLEDTIRRYQNKTIESAQVIAELIELAKKIRDEQSRGEKTGLTNDELAFYDALAENESALKELGDETLKKITFELVTMLRNSTTIDWSIKENVRAKIRINIKKLLNKYNYPPDKQDQAIKTVIEQADIICKDWGENN